MYEALEVNAPSLTRVHYRVSLGHAGIECRHAQVSDYELSRQNDRRRWILKKGKHEAVNAVFHPLGVLSPCMEQV